MTRMETACHNPRSAYAIVELSTTITVEVRRVDCRLAERVEAYAHSGIELSNAKRASLDRPGSLPVRSDPGLAMVVWP